LPLFWAKGNQQHLHLPFLAILANKVNKITFITLFLANKVNNITIITAFLANKVNNIPIIIAFLANKLNSITDITAFLANKLNNITAFLANKLNNITIITAFLANKVNNITIITTILAIMVPTQDIHHHRLPCQQSKQLPHHHRKNRTNKNKNVKYLHFFSGDAHHQEHLYREPGRVGHLPVRLHHAPHPGGPHHQILDPGTRSGMYRRNAYQAPKEHTVNIESKADICSGYQG
jgi:hypothetical protein